MRKFIKSAIALLGIVFILSATVKYGEAEEIGDENLETTQETIQPTIAEPLPFEDNTPIEVTIASPDENKILEEYIELKNSYKYKDDNNYERYQGRLYIPAVNIDVALYYGNQQEITNRADSANLYMSFQYEGLVIADHKDQDFQTLINVQPGMFGYVVFPDNSAVKIECVSAVNGHNTEAELTDDEYNIVTGPHAYLTYTCLENWKNIRICEWDIVPNVYVYVDKR